MRARALDRALESLHRFRTEQERRGVIEFPRTLGEMYTEHLALAELRAFWPFSSVNESGNVLDLSGQARTLTNNGTTGRFVWVDLVPYASLNGTTQYFSRADEAGISITGALTLGGWFMFDREDTNEGVFNQLGAAGNRAYGLQKLLAGNVVRMAVSGDGTALVDAETAAVSNGTWYHIVGRYTPSTEVAIFINGVKSVETVSVPAALFNSTAALETGRLASAAEYMDGRCALCFLCASALADARIQRLFKLGRLFFGV